MNTYEKKQAARKANYEARAEQARQQSNSAYEHAKSMAQVIPFGQPILVGHHSEGADRRYRARIRRGFEKSFELQRRAEHYADKAAAVGKGGISSDDPQAVEKLKGQLMQMQRAHDTMKALNAVIRRHAKNDTTEQIAALVETGLIDEEKARHLLTPDFAGRIGFAAYQLQNSNASIRRITHRIKELEKAADRPETEHTGDGYKYREDPTENRAMFQFDAKPEKGTREVLKRHGFRWSPSRCAWVRQLTGNAQWAARDVIRFLEDAAEE